MFLVTLFFFPSTPPFPPPAPPKKLKIIREKNTVGSQRLSSCSGHSFHCAEVAWISFGVWTSFWLGLFHHPIFLGNNYSICKYNYVFTYRNTCIYTYAYLWNISMYIKRLAKFTCIIGDRSRERERGDLFLVLKVHWRKPLNEGLPLRIFFKSVGSQSVKFFGLGSRGGCGGNCTKGKLAMLRWTCFLGCI